MILPSIDPTGPLAPFADWFRTVRGILSNGWTIRDQAAGEVKTIRWAGAPLNISTRLRARPVAVVCLSATNSTTGDCISGGVVAWRWVGEQGSMRISSVSAATAGDDVTLWIVGG